MQDNTPNDLTPDLVSWCDPQDADTTASPAPCSFDENGWVGKGALGPNGANTLLTARSMHPGGVLAALCDGSVRFVSESIDANTWKSLGTPAGGEVISSGRF